MDDPYKVEYYISPDGIRELRDRYATSYEFVSQLMYYIREAPLLGLEVPSWLSQAVDHNCRRMDSDITQELVRRGL